MVATFAWGLGFYGHGIYLAELQRAKGWPTSLMSTATTLYYLSGSLLVIYVSDILQRLGPRRMLLAGATLFSIAVAGIAYVVRALAAVRGLSRHGDRLDAGQRRRADQCRRPLVLREARARHQPCADRRELRRHHPDAADGGSRLALGLSRRDARHGRRDVRDSRRDDPAVCRQAAETGPTAAAAAQSGLSGRRGLDARARAAQPAVLDHDAAVCARDRRAGRLPRSSACLSCSRRWACRPQATRSPSRPRWPCWDGSSSAR